VKGLAIYTIVIFGLALFGCLTTDTSGIEWLGMIMLTPILVFAMLYIIKDAKKVQPTVYTRQLIICSNCHMQNLPTSSFCYSCGNVLQQRGVI
jgi:hypothetical protein